MPKKTKREKRLAEVRRSSYQMPPHSSSTASVEPSERNDSHMFSYKPTLQSASKKNVMQVEELSAIKKDLIKTVIITVTILVGEIMLSYYLS